ncbi:MAG TPA: NAD(P)-dependent oxidoreductase [Thermomicrobiales bacterium]|nr:NAD(P)-dependent oxidoreductase [Thermomicrobiales bacterium]
MRILVTGASSNLASGIIEPLATNHELVLSDIVPVESAHPFVEADVRKRDEIIAAAKGVDVIIHTPAWHGIQLKTHSEAEFWELNVDGTFNMFQAALANGVKKVIWISSQSVFSNENIYGITKIVGEELCRYYHRVHGISVLMLRPHDFTPIRSHRHYGERLLRGGVDRRDVHQATVLAVDNTTVG